MKWPDPLEDLSVLWSPLYLVRTSLRASASGFMIVPHIHLLNLEMPSEQASFALHSYLMMIPPFM